MYHFTFNTKSSLISDFSATKAQSHEDKPKAINWISHLCVSLSPGGFVQFNFLWFSGVDKHIEFDIFHFFFSHFVVFSLCHFYIRHLSFVIFHFSFYHFIILSFYRFIILSFCRFVVLSFCHFFTFISKHNAVLNSEVSGQAIFRPSLFCFQWLIFPAPSNLTDSILPALLPSETICNSVPVAGTVIQKA